MIGTTRQRLDELPYERRVCRIEHTPLCLCDLKSPKLRATALPRRATMEEEVEAIFFSREQF